LPKWKLVDGDVGALTRAYNVLRAGHGTYLAAIEIEAFLNVWKDSPRAWLAESGFVGVAENAAEHSLVLAPFGEGFSDDARRLIVELVPAWNIRVLRATTSTLAGDALCEAIGMRYDGLLRQLVPFQNGTGPEWKDAGFWSILPSDLTAAKEP
jgi:hypothetical protein